jgi:ssRNA-specific RNase YbeY (16S rRNA maturation enzyme)
MFKQVVFSCLRQDKSSVIKTLHKKSSGLTHLEQKSARNNDGPTNTVLFFTWTSTETGVELIKFQFPMPFLNADLFICFDDVNKQESICSRKKKKTLL